MAINLTPDWFQKRWSEAKNRAGRRYAEQLNVSLPLSRYFSATTQTRDFFARFGELETALQKVWKDQPLPGAPKGSEEAISRIEALVRSTSSGLRDLAALLASAPSVVHFGNTAAAARGVANEAEAPFRAAVEQSRIASPEDRSAVERWVDWFSNISNAANEIEDFLVSPATLCTNAPALLLLGPAGTGKTHLLCEMTKQRIELETPSLIFLAQAFQLPFTDVLQTLANSVGWTGPPEEFFGALGAIARSQHTRCLISIDAINEGHRESWSKALPNLAGLPQRYPGLALVISCRTPFEKMIVPDPSELGLTVAYHFGFPAEVQSGAVEKYFKGYCIPLPEVPLLEEEFSNPLFLKLFCEALERATVQDKHKQIRDIASGQRGMTYILEYFVDEKDRIISERLGTPPGLSWRFLKGEFSTALAEQHAQTMRLTDATRLADALQPAEMPSGTFLQALINEDILSEDITFDEHSQPTEVVRLTYQKFADHLLARHLLARQFDSASEETIKASLRDPSRLGFYFSDQEVALSQASIVQALLIEFPSRVKNRGELLDYLDWDSIPGRICENFIEGLYWRDPESVNESTAKWVTKFLRHDQLREPTLNVLVALSVKPQHPFRASRLDGFLRCGRIVERDLFWTEYLRRSFDRGTPMRLLIWAEDQLSKNSPADFVSAYISVLKWFLTSTQRAFRDRVTHALFRIGLTTPKTLFDATLESLDINDPYVPQRMLAASYGVAMALSFTEDGSEFQTTILPYYAGQLFSQMFNHESKYATTHVLSRDYARRTVQLALMVQPGFLSEAEVALMTPPFRFGGIRQWGESEDRDKGRNRNGDSPLGMDFANYTLGRLVKNRFAYQDTPEYSLVKRQVLWRIYDLGYTLEDFSKADQEIAGMSWRQETRGRGVGKTDRYGKKYAWIAFYELAGYREDEGLLDRDERISDADIDPSFPEDPRFTAVFDHPWIGHTGTVREWMFSNFRPPVEDKLVLPAIHGLPGPWVLLHGSVNRETEDKTIFTLFDGILVRQDQVAGAISTLSAESASGRQTPSSEEEHYTYAGEIPWSDTWRLQQYPSSVGYGANEVEVFLTARDYAWESYHSHENPLRGIPFPSKELASDLNLYVQIPSVTMAQRGSNRVATLLVLTGEPYHDSEMLLFIRQDLLGDYLSRKGLDFILFAWGERRANHVRQRDGREEEGNFEIKDVIHKQGFYYTGRGFDRFL